MPERCMQSPPTSQQCHPPCLSVSPALTNVSACGWGDLVLLLVQAEEYERRRLEQEEGVKAKGFFRVARDELHLWKDAEDKECDEQHDETSAGRSIRAKPGGVVQEHFSSKSAERPAASPSPSSSTHGTPRASEALPAHSLTPFQRFCFTKSTALQYNQTWEARSTQAQHCRQSRSERSTGVDRKLRSERHWASPHAQSAEDDTCHGADGNTLYVGTLAVAAASRPRRDTWSWSKSRTRSTSAPMAAPTLTNTYGSAARRALAMQLIFDRLSYEGKSIVARQAESLGLLPSAFVDANALEAARLETRTSSAPSDEHLRDVDATLLDCVSDVTQTASSGELKQRRSTTLQTSPAPMSPFGESPAEVL